MDSAMRKEFNRGGTESRGRKSGATCIKRKTFAPNSETDAQLFSRHEVINVPKVSGKVRGRLPKRRENCMVIMGRRCWAKLG